MQGDYASKGNRIAKATDIILELNTVLDMDKGGQIAQNLRSLYNFMQQHLSEANLKKDAAMVQDVINLLEELKQGWQSRTNKLSSPSFCLSDGCVKI